jgi:hypothetical protein
VLFAVYPEAQKGQGFPARYKDAYPAAMGRLALSTGLEIQKLVPYYCSDYAAFFAPLYAVDVARQVLFKTLNLRNLCENFVIVLRKP